MARNIGPTRQVDLVLLGAGAAIWVPWLIIGIFFLQQLRGWQLVWGSNLGAIGGVVFVTGLVRTIQRRRA